MMYPLLVYIYTLRVIHHHSDCLTAHAILFWCHNTTKRLTRSKEGTIRLEPDEVGGTEVDITPTRVGVMSYDHMTKPWSDTEQSCRQRIYSAWQLSPNNQVVRGQHKESLLCINRSQQCSSQAARHTSRYLSDIIYLLILASNYFSLFFFTIKKWN